ncbi:MAG TPA: substrate-binding domain-containing protein [Arenicellales bacterium]|jgi:tungstate transport system substrate-binding protein|nr:substrate-binding domain-containing protein [Arenicellales bacterium]MEC8871498.1 substrate-binding domain-containing protein [Pseudomonadota bacterium]MEC8961878.1 substrate-binding domain-containing protein [Pseudomonadota bacterium]HJM02775.1 substrate-binding domain-containing protein [Arenicellales bacterium]|tara:strand:+ start:6502 stop:7335 length:834 start_codon:yes stop_codon:yes gene_type:complete
MSAATKIFLCLITILASQVFIPWSANASERFIVVASTTSTENSGLYSFVLPRFSEQTGIEVRVVAVGTGQALHIAQNGDADVLLVHHRPSEDQFISQGYGVTRYDLMYNDYILVGPRDDPASVLSAANVIGAVQRIATNKSLFISRGDDSGTHKKELELWNQSGIDTTKVGNGWYQETGRGMGGTLNMASALDAYTLSDRATWLKFGNKGRLDILFQSDPPLFNPYGIILVNPEKHPHIKTRDGQTFIEWMLSEAGQTLIADYRILGQQAFFPTAKP